MATYTKTESWAVDDREPPLRMHVFTREGNALKDLSSAAAPTFYMLDTATGALKLDGLTAGASIEDGVNGILKYSWQTGDTDTVGIYLAWFTVTIGGLVLTTTPVEVLIEDAHKRRF